MMVIVMTGVVMSVPPMGAVFGPRFFLERKFLADADIEFGHAFLLILMPGIESRHSYVNQIVIKIYAYDFAAVFRVGTGARQMSRIAGGVRR